MKTSPSIPILTHLSPDPGMGAMVFLSMLLHLAAISAVFLLPNLASSRTYYSPVYSVRLVNVLPSPPPEGKAASTAETLPSSSPPPAVKEKEKPVSLAAKTQEDPEKKIAEAIERIRQRKEDKRVDTAINQIRQRQEEKSVDSAIERIRGAKEAAQVDSAIERIRKKVTIGSTGAVETGDPGTGGASSGFMSIRHKMYYNLIWQRIRNAWVLPEEVLRGKKDLETIIAIRIGRDGQIIDIQFEKKSGNPYLDESALRAIKKANPLPPLPPGFEEDKFDVGVRFTPSDL
ncbi:MAG TPA: TonB family protein [Thermodesulfobacteriota bacterium]|nr:TonB family protein [Thermodesulfobacteriota bacterium]